MTSDKSEPSFNPDPDPFLSLTPEPTPPQELAWLTRLEQERSKDRAMLATVLQEGVEELRRTRRGRVRFRLFVGAVMLAFLLSSVAAQWNDVEEIAGEHHTSVVHLSGIIMAEAEASAEHVTEALQSAFEDKGTKGVVLVVNTPGGSAVQAGMIHDEIQRLRKKHPTIPLYASLEDLCASGGYYVASAAQEIYADKATLVGSIGVLMEGFGFVEALGKLGIENRTLTAGEHKAFLDPFSPVREKEKAHAQSLLNKIHGQFVEVVKNGRGKRLKASDAQLFNGLIWTGEEAAGLGLVDGLGSTAWIAREKIKAEKIVDFSYEEDWYNRLSKKMVGTFLHLLQAGSLPLLR